jgi:hypothetical protein
VCVCVCVCVLVGSKGEGGVRPVEETKAAKAVVEGKVPALHDFVLLLSGLLDLLSQFSMLM